MEQSLSGFGKTDSVPIVELLVPILLFWWFLRLLARPSLIGELIDQVTERLYVFRGTALGAIVCTFVGVRWLSFLQPVWHDFRSQSFLRACLWIALWGVVVAAVGTAGVAVAEATRAIRRHQESAAAGHLLREVVLITLIGLSAVKWGQTVSPRYQILGLIIVVLAAIFESRAYPDFSNAARFALCVPVLFSWWDFLKLRIFELYDGWLIGLLAGSRWSFVVTVTILVFGMGGLALTAIFVLRPVWFALYLDALAGLLLRIYFALDPSGHLYFRLQHLRHSRLGWLSRLCNWILILLSWFVGRWPAELLPAVQSTGRVDEFVELRSKRANAEVEAVWWSWRLACWTLLTGIGKRQELRDLAVMLRSALNVQVRWLLVRAGTLKCPHCDQLSQPESALHTALALDVCIQRRCLLTLAFNGLRPVFREALDRVRALYEALAGLKSDLPIPLVNWRLMAVRHGPRDFELAEITRAKVLSWLDSHGPWVPAAVSLLFIVFQMQGDYAGLSDTPWRLEEQGWIGTPADERDAGEAWGLLAQEVSGARREWALQQCLNHCTASRDPEWLEAAKKLLDKCLRTAEAAHA